MDDASTLTTLGWDSGWAAATQPWHSLGFRPARVSGVDRGACDVLSAAGASRATLGGAVLGGMAADSTTGPCTGDWVLLRDWPDARVTVEAVLPRRTAVVRAAASGESRGQVLAANVDVVLVVAALDVDPDLGRLERLLALAWESGARPVVVLTKADLVADGEMVAADVAAIAPGADVLVVSAVTRQGLAELGAVAGPGVTVAAIGPSGVGKSTLANALGSSVDLPTGSVGVTGKGRHVTVRRELVQLSGGGLLVDTPGLRGVGVIGLETGLDLAFPEVERLAEGCRFTDCGHVAEPGCAVLAAVESGDLAQRRLDSWHKLAREVRWIERRADARLRAEERRKWRLISKSSRSMRQSGLARP